MDDKKLKEEFIKYFGEDKWNQEKVLGKIEQENLFLSVQLKIEPLPVIFEPMKEATAKFHILDGYISLSEDLMEQGYQVILESFLHEFKHYVQANNYLDHKEDTISIAFGNELKNGRKEFSIVDYLLSPLEIDAIAFSQAMMEYVYELPYTVLPKEYQEIIDEYKKNNNVLAFLV